MIYANWCISNNFGDALNPWLIKKITGEYPLYAPQDSYFEKFIVSGSILNWADKDTIVWGAGVANSTDLVNPDATILAVRGKLSQSITHVNRTKSTPNVYGDPALLLPRFYEPKTTKKYALGIIPHYINQAEVINSNLMKNNNIKFINVFSGIEDFIDDVASCNAILSSSLHGLIVADAYGISSKWFEGANRLGGDGTKFKDYFLSVNIGLYKPLKFYKINNMSVDLLLNTIGEVKAKYDDNLLWNSCPFK